ncbi:MAG: gliding motility-associated ABC transporter substrate-binding protein GldG [Prevotellaceae bacterium]|jgi:ABC-2 type transport system permease protein|nr:gliding motility-associated ABC transporter substrate-binding protein GldG [Prevotellaceae bacterium]
MKNIRPYLIVALVLVALNVLSAFCFFRLDLTSEKRYSISENTKSLMSGLDKKTHIRIYLDGDLNPGFLRLKKSTKELLDEFRVYTREDFGYEFINPSAAGTQKEREANYIALESRGLRAMVVYDKDEEGKAIQKVVFPWAEIIYGKDTIPVNLLENNPRMSGSQNLNNSIENLEFRLSDAIRVHTMKTINKIAFIEGHGEFPPELVYDASVAFSRYFQVDRGQIGNDPDILKPYKAIVIANPQTPFSEQEKFVIDQYIMNGGRVLWLINGVRLAMDSLSTVGVSPAIPLNVNLDDQLFRYGVRLSPVILQDMQCTQVPMNVARPGDPPKFEPMPWYYAPLLLASPEHPISRNLVEVRAEFASALDLSVSQHASIKKTVLLVTSNASHIIATPTRIDLNTMYDMDSKTYFNTGYIPVAAALEGRFPSIFTNRMAPEGIVRRGKIQSESRPTRMVVVANADIIRNDVQNNGQSIIPMPMGYDRYSKQEFGNRSFILNSILYLADDDGWLQLRSREFKLRMLNKKEVVSGKKKWQIINVGVPLLLVLAFALGYSLVRRKIYSS